MLLLTCASAVATVAVAGSGAGPIDSLRRATVLASSDTLSAAAAVAHAVATAALGYLTLIGLLNLLCSLVPARGPVPRRLRRLLGVLTPRVLTAGVAGLVVVSTSVTPVAAEGHADVRSDAVSTATSPPVMHLVDAPPETPPPTAPRLEPVPTSAVPRTTPAPRTAAAPSTPAPPVSSPDASRSQAPDAASGPSTRPNPRANAPAVRTTHVVRPGEHFWSIAEAVVAARPDTQLDTAAYWRLLVEANRHRLVDRDNPDLLHPGQELVLP